jgi:hypothetical protein
LSTAAELSDFPNEKEKNMSTEEDKLVALRENKGRWNFEETQRLRAGVAKYGTDNWIAVASMVGSRDRDQCKKKWRRSLDPNIKIGQWTEEEDEKLREGVAKYGERSWKLVSEYLNNGRTNYMCKNHWETLSDKNWTPQVY